MNTHKAVSALLPVLLVFLITSCDFIYDYDNCPQEVSLQVNIDWKNAPGAAPEGMACMFYSVPGGGLWRFDFADIHGGEVFLPAGGYRTLTFNDDTSGIIFDNEGSYDSISCTCRRGGLFDGLGGTAANPLGPGSNGDEPVEICPDMMWADAIAGFGLDYGSVSVVRHEGDEAVTSTRREIAYYPRPAVATYRFIISDIENMDGVARMCASLSGMAGSLRLRDLEPGGGAVTLPLAARRTAADVAEGRFYTFGLPGTDRSIANVLTLYVWLSDGSKLQYHFDVTDQAHDAPDPMDVTLRAGGIVLPEVEKPEIGDGAFEVEVDGWTVIEIDIVN